MQLGIFLPTGSNGFMMSTTSPQFEPSFALNSTVTRLAERYGFEFVLSMIKFRGFDSPSGYWDRNIEAFTLMSALAVVTTRIRLVASVAVLTMPPALAARMTATIDDISNGRFGVNIVSGWQRDEYSQMGLWPGAEHYARRYAYCAEYVTILRELLETGRSDFKGSFFTMEDCRLEPHPRGPITVVCAGQSDQGTRFASQYGDFNFCASIGINSPDRIAPSVARLVAENERTGRQVGALVSVMIVADDTDAAAMAKWETYRAGTDLELLSRRAKIAGGDPSADPYATPNRSRLSGDPPKPVSGGVLVGSHASIARMLDELGRIPGVSGAMLSFDEYVSGIERFGQHIQPLMTTRTHVVAPA